MLPAITAAGYLRTEQRTFRHDDIDRLQTAFVQGNLVVDQGAEDVEHGRFSDRRRRVEDVERIFPICIQH